ncbi:MAG: PAS domain-containing protein [Desulfobulbaceae bacterium]|nr:PAS domain-containing protein [Desulfobulbaceae bacterium]
MDIAYTSTDMIHLNDFDGLILYANKATKTILGYTLDEVVNNPAVDIVHSEDHETVINVIVGKGNSKIQEEVDGGV